jgi:hypothetical protein
MVLVITSLGSYELPAESYHMPKELEKEHEIYLSYQLAFLKEMDSLSARIRESAGRANLIMFND